MFGQWIYQVSKFINPNLDKVIQNFQVLNYM